MPEIRKIIKEFPNYEITSYGRVFNLKTGREMALSPTQHGDLTVGLVRDHHQYRYSVKGLVARYFVPGESEFFDTPILLNGDRNDLRADNIAWRPRWFAWLWTRQFSQMFSWYYFGPIIDMTTKMQYENYLQASMENGILCSDIKESIYNGKLVFPTHQYFEYVR